MKTPVEIVFSEVRHPGISRYQKIRLPGQVGHLEHEPLQPEESASTGTHGLNLKLNLSVEPARRC